VCADWLQIEQCLSDADFQLSVELWFTEEELRDETVLQQLSTRTVTIHVKHDSGVHHYLPLQFDYFHLSAVLLTVHASLLALHPSYIRFFRIIIIIIIIIIRRRRFEINTLS